jgi:hypothetical protein
VNAAQLGSEGSRAVRFNALLAVELDPVRRLERMNDLRLAAAVAIADRVEVAEALLGGVPVPSWRLDGAWAEALQLAGDVVLDDELALRVVAHGPMEPA